MNLGSLLVFLAVVSAASAEDTADARAKVELTPELQEQFLRAFEFSKIPQGKNKKKPLKLEDVPDFLLEAYRQQTGHEEGARSTNFRTPGAHTAWANTLTTHAARVVSRPRGFDWRLQTVLEFKGFEPLEPAVNELQAALLKVYWKPRLSVKRKSGTFRARAYDIVRLARGDPDARVTSLHDVRRIHHRDADLDEGWYEFDVTGAVARWSRHKTRTPRLLLEREPLRVRERPDWRVTPHGDFAEAYLLVYSESAQHRAGRERRSGRKNGGGKKKRRHRKPRREPCQRREMYVDFKEVGWSDWIFAPQGYDANVCVGECRFPLADHLNGTNHAIVQTLVHGVNPSAVPQACCVPTDLSPMSMLYHDEYEKLVLKNYEEMIVEGCGCR